MQEVVVNLQEVEEAAEVEVEVDSLLLRDMTIMRVRRMAWYMLVPS